MFLNVINDYFKNLERDNYNFNVMVANQKVFENFKNTKGLCLDWDHTRNKVETQIEVLRERLKENDPLFNEVLK